DVVLNSLAGEAITRGLEILRPYGRFVEIGKRDIYDNSPVGLLPFSKNLAYFAVDLDRMARERPAVVGGMLREIVTLVDAGEIQPLPLTSFPATQMADAFRYMAQSKHIGKIVIVPQGDKVPVFVQADSGVRDDSSYLITGGLGGLGLTVMRWLAAQGARQIVLTARRDPGESARAEIEAVRAAGVDVQTVRCDVTDAAAVEQLVEDIQQRLLPLRGVFHAAGLLDDAMLLQLDPEHLRNAMRPKVTGAWNLHVATQDVELDWFVLFSSVTAVLGTPGQANYAAGNAFMDGLAHYRRARNLAALSINWGPWSEIGLAAAQANRGDRLAMRGVGSIAPEQGVIALERLLGLGITQASVMPFAVEQWTQTYVAAAQSSLLADLITSDIPLAESDRVESDEDIRALIWAAENRVARIRLLETHVQEHVGYVLGMAAARVDVQKPLRNMGLDSLMTLELRNRLEHSLHLKLPATLAFNYPTVAALAHYLLERLDAERPEERAVETAEIASEPSTDELEGLMQDEIEAMLAEELSSLDDLLKGNVSGVE
ncbi:MAG TPA: SDR family NAD(P)-dependent oxidoreductase, partial [Spirillospora sp.]|nr:SDR family NAD(P)-dependent oxidoreductase [Spirillospora sp.]